ncbi:hypothetical protein B0T16DRAFT_403551 [Cercophora newfieldiana]|uniref:Uncharacterized protein n=1 Tax=Cercophora newfieldiana TaxID=92897 RepID=A0AA40CW21_9PEZI|nr:hypothetical protein B0T16DRAFT_403551 [Cercophora newfieldiana]
MTSMSHPSPGHTCLPRSQAMGPVWWGSFFSGAAFVSGVNAYDVAVSPHLTLSFTSTYLPRGIDWMAWGSFV